MEKYAYISDSRWDVSLDLRPPSPASQHILLVYNTATSKWTMFVPLQAFAGRWSPVTMQVSWIWTRTNHAGMPEWRQSLWVTALTVDCRADYHPIPLQAGRPLIRSIRVTIKGRSIVGAAWGFERRSMTGGWWNSGRVGEKCLSHQSLRSL